MPGKKTSERQKRGRVGPQVELPKREPFPVKKEYRQAICPVCGVSHGLKRLRYPQKGEKFTPSDQSYWDWLNQIDEERALGSAQPFGVIQEVGGGKGHSFRVIGHFTPEEDQDGFYPIVKARFLIALKRWLINGWITREEVASLISKI